MGLQNEDIAQARSLRKSGTRGIGVFLMYKSNRAYVESQYSRYVYIYIFMHNNRLLISHQSPSQHFHAQMLQTSII